MSPTEKKLRDIAAAARAIDSGKPYTHAGATWPALSMVATDAAERVARGERAGARLVQAGRLDAAHARLVAVYRAGEIAARILAALEPRRARTLRSNEKARD